MSKSFYMQCKSLHSLPNFASTTQRIQVENGQCVSVLFIILVIVDIHRHRFEIYMLESEIHKNVDIVFGIKNVFKFEKEREQKSPEDNYPQLDPDDDRRHMTDREILEKYINLNNSCLNKEE